MRILLIPPPRHLPCACDPAALAQTLREAGHSVSVGAVPHAGVLGAWVAAFAAVRAHAQHDRSIVCEDLGASLGVWLARWITRRPYALLVTTTKLPRYRHWPLWPWLLCSVYKRAEAVAVFNSDARDTMIKFGVRRQVLTLCGPPCVLRAQAVAEAAPLRVIASAPPESPFSNAALLRVLGHLLEKVPRAEMLVVASGGDRALEDRCAAMGLEANFRVVDELPDSTHGVALVYAARGEMPNIRFAAEALGAGWPVAATRHPVLTDWLREDETALLSAAGNETAAADAVATLLRSPARAQRLADAAHALAETRHTWARLVDLLLG